MPPKHSEKKPAEKLLALYTLLMLQGERALSIAEIAHLLECSKQTVLRLLDQMEASGYGKLDEPIIRGREHYYRLSSLPKTELHVGLKELVQLNLCRNILLQILPNGVSSVLKEVNTNIDNNFSCKASNIAISPANNITQMYYKGYIDYTSYEKQYTQLMQGIYKQKVCVVTYKKNPSSPARTFSFAPMCIVSYRESISFLGWEVSEKGKVCQKYENSLSLYLQRCLDVQLSKRSSAHLSEIQPIQTTETITPFGIMHGEPFLVRILFTPEVASYIYDRIWSNRQEITINEDGSLLLDFDAQSETEILSWVLGFGAKAKVLEPKWLQEDIKKQVLELDKSY